MAAIPMRAVAVGVTLPDLSAMTTAPLAKVTLTWPAMQHVASYNIYRTPASGGDATQVQLIGTVPQPSGSSVTFDDTGLAPTTQTPLLIGATGKWNAVSNLTTARFGATAAIAQGPVTATTSTIYLYVAGGGPDTALTTATLLDNYEWTKVDITLADGSEAVSTFAVGRNSGNTANQSIGGGRACSTAYSADHAFKSQIAAGTSFVYFGSGLSKSTGFSLVNATNTGSTSTASASGDLGTLTAVSAAGTGGAAAATVTGYLFALGGINNGTTLQDTFSAQACPATGCTGTSPPALTTWTNGGGGTPNVKRMFSTSVVEGPYIYLFGGSTNTTGSNATPSVERAVY